MTVDDIFAAINQAEPAEALAVAESMLAQYDGPDKEVITPHIMEMVAVKIPIENL